MRFYSVMIPRHDSRLSALSTTQTRGTLASRVSFSLWLATGSPAGAGWLSERPGHAHSHTGNLAAPPRPRARERTSNYQDSQPSLPQRSINPSSPPLTSYNLFLFISPLLYFPTRERSPTTFSSSPTHQPSCLTLSSTRDPSRDTEDGSPPSRPARRTRT